jgi:hypothetical protein
LRLPGRAPGATAPGAPFSSRTPPPNAISRTSSASAGAHIRALGSLMARSSDADAVKAQVAAALDDPRLPETLPRRSPASAAPLEAGQPHSALPRTPHRSRPEGSPAPRARSVLEAATATPTSGTGRASGAPPAQTSPAPPPHRRRRARAPPPARPAVARGTEPEVEAVRLPGDVDIEWVVAVRDRPRPPLECPHVERLVGAGVADDVRARVLGSSRGRTGAATPRGKCPRRL